APLIFTAGRSPFSVAVGDFNGDGRLDLVTANISSNDVSVLLGNGDGSFQPARNFATGGTQPVSVVVGDFNGDGVLDLAVVNSSSNTVSVLLGNGDGTFQAPLTVAAGTNPVSVAVGDFNGDGAVDLAVTNVGLDFNNEVGDVAVRLGNRNGTFQAAWNFGAGVGASSVAVSDFNGDGKPDLAVGNTASRTVSVLINNTPPPHHRQGQPLDLLQSSLLTGGAALDVEAG